jgi:hypothetical protein
MEMFLTVCYATALTPLGSRQGGPRTPPPTFHPFSAIKATCVWNSNAAAGVFYSLSLLAHIHMMHDGMLWGRKWSVK